MLTVISVFSNPSFKDVTNITQDLENLNQTCPLEWILITDNSDWTIFPSVLNSTLDIKPIFTDCVDKPVEMMRNLALPLSKGDWIMALDPGYKMNYEVISTMCKLMSESVRWLGANVECVNSIHQLQHSGEVNRGIVYDYWLTHNHVLPFAPETFIVDKRLWSAWGGWQVAERAGTELSILRFTDGNEGYIMDKIMFTTQTLPKNSDTAYEQCVALIYEIMEAQRDMLF